MSPDLKEIFDRINEEMDGSPDWRSHLLQRAIEDAFQVGYDMGYSQGHDAGKCSP